MRHVGPCSCIVGTRNTSWNFIGLKDRMLNKKAWLMTIKHGTWFEACHQRHLEFIFLHEVCFQFGHPDPIAFSLIRRWKILKWKICFATISGGECSGGKSADVTSNLRTFIGWPIGSLWDQELVGMWKPRQGAQGWWRLTHLNEEFRTQYLRNDKNTEHVYYIHIFL